MQQTLKYICFLVLAFSTTIIVAQNNSFNKSEGSFSVRGSVVESDTNEPIPKVNIEINGGAYTTTDQLGEFRIVAKKGDQLIIRHEDFQTIYYTIESNERIKVKVEPNPLKSSSKHLVKRKNYQQFNSLIDSSEAYLKKDAQKSIAFIADALQESGSTKQNGEAYEVLGDVYTFWKQFDLAITNYKISLQNHQTNEVRLKLAGAYYQNKNYQESISAYKSISRRGLSNWQSVILDEGLGDVYLATREYNKAIEAYNSGLQVARKHLITPKITDLNSKLAETYDASGSKQEAEGLFQNSLQLATQENQVRAAEEKIKVADFENRNQAYANEIELRKEALEDIENIQNDSVILNESALTPQKQNYKIGNAYYLQKDYDNAIPFLQRSIVEADEREDLVVKKDATRKLSELYRDAEDYKKALSTYQDYVELVDELYIKKEQEISQSARFRKDLTDKQNRITSLESDRELSESKYELTQARNKNQQLIIYSLLGGLVLASIAGFLMFKYIRQQRLANNLLALKSLRSQMNPHFIFNALNSVNSFIAINDERKANKYLSDFSALMRSVLENSEEDFIPLSKEMELIEVYTKLEHFRFQDKFDYTITIDENINVNEFQIPPMLLQPYIENAVWHGLRYKKEKGELNINIDKLSQDTITITITDNGIGRERSKALKTQHQKKQNSKGMGNIKKRVAILNAMYKDKVDVFIDDYLDEEDTGTKVVVTLKKD